VVGGIAGAIAGLIVKGEGFGLIGNVVVGIIGAVIGHYLFGVLDVSIGQGMIKFLIEAVIGAVVLLFVVNLIKKL
jgi:uncharacterized membrane protein YeaQ/YmgE (transglycosylase-associated protein family)